ncbi:MAG: kinase/pyrophosphorylase [Thermodesulfovibrionales bacterium]|nr:kinase/pyrophosphorylase [Thermodesulfovibrionales bacterium]
MESLVKFREARLEQLGLAPYAKYADPVQADEIEWCKEYLKQNPRWRVMDVSNKAIEEVAACIVNAYRTGRKPT